MSTQDFNRDKRTYSKSNYVKVLEILTPEIYLTEDIGLSGLGGDPVSVLINSHINICNNIDKVINVSALANSPTCSSLDNVSGFSKFFIKQNRLSRLRCRDFENNILFPLDRSFGEFTSSSAFKSYLEDTLFPSITLNTPTEKFESETGTTNTSGAHKYLIDNLSWIYFLNTSGDESGGYNLEPSSLAIDLLVKKSYVGEAIEINDFIKAMQEFVWQNYETCTTWERFGPIPGEFATSSNISNEASSYTSGTQQLDKLKTLVDVVYSPLYADRQDERVKDAFDDFINLSTLLSDVAPKGPFYNLLRAFSYSFADTNNEITTLESFNDIENCPEEYLELLAELIGWKLFGDDPSRWRLQLKNAVDIYKKTGTKESIQFALDSLFSKDVYSLSSNIHELWESYIPNLIFYALATDASAFANFENYEIAKTAMGSKRWPWITNDAKNSMEDNLRFAVDHIMLELATHPEYADHFQIAGKPFPIGGKVGENDFIFHYRGRKFPIPPWEEIPYYTKTYLTEGIIRAIVDRLACYGVTTSFAQEVGKYIRQNSILATDHIREGNGWLLFTSAQETPPNFNTVIQDISNSREEFLPLWNGKSSHFRITLSGEDFNFAKKGLDTDSKLALYESLRIVKTFSPAHAVPDPRLMLEDVDDVLKSDVTQPYIGLNNQETYNLSSDTIIKGGGQVVGGKTGAGLSRYTTSGLGMLGWKRVAGTGSNLVPFSRSDVNHVNDSLMSASATYTASVPRNALRRRDFRYSLPAEGFYTRDGFNSPQFWNTSSVLETSYTSSLGYLPLGYVPSAGHYYGISSYKDIPEVYGACQVRENILSSFSGVAVSTTYPVRGVSSLSSAEYYIDRNQLDPFVAVLHKIIERRKLLLAELIINKDLSAYSRDFSWKNVSASYANSSTESGDWAPSSTADYRGFSFGRSVHQLYKDYTNIFYRHKLRPDIWELEGPTIFAHIWGSILRNSSFDKYGPTYNQFPVVVASSIATASSLYNNGERSSVVPGETANTHGVFASGQLAAYGTYIASTTDELVASGIGITSTLEVRNAKIISGVELIHTSSTPSDTENSFTIFNIDSSHRREISDANNFSILNPLIKMRAFEGLSRIKFDTATYGNPSDEFYPRATNLLTPDHEFEFKIKSLASNEKGTHLGVGVMLGVWIHTGAEGGHVWSWSPTTEKWRLDRTSDITRNFILENLTHLYKYPESVRTERKTDPGEGGELIGEGECINFYAPPNPGDNVPIITSFNDKEFTEFSVKFNTKNVIMSLPEEYYKGSVTNLKRDIRLLHRQDQNYVFEFFMVPELHGGPVNSSKFTLFDKVNLVDLTNKEKAGVFVSGATVSGLHRDVVVDLSKYDITEIFKHFNNIAGANFRTKFATRIASDAAGSMGGGFTTSGGSRANYRFHPSLFGNALEESSGHYEFLEFVN